MKNILLILGFVCGIAFTNAQYVSQDKTVGVNTDLPGSTLQVKGSIAGEYTSIAANTYTLLDTDYYINGQEPQMEYSHYQRHLLQLIRREDYIMSLIKLIALI